MTLTNKDFKALNDLLDQKIEEKAETLLVTKDEIRHLTTKDEFYDREDKLVSELKTIREEITVVSGLQEQVHDEERLINIAYESLERKGVKYRYFDKQDVLQTLLFTIIGTLPISTSWLSS